MALKIITRKELIAKLYDTKGTSFVTFTAQVDPAMLRTDNPFFKEGECLLQKYAKINGAIGFIYANSVQRQRVKEYAREYAGAGEVVDTVFTGYSPGPITWRPEREFNPFEAPFKAEPRKWGLRIKGTPIVEYTNEKGESNTYLEVLILTVYEHHYIDQEGNRLTADSSLEHYGAPDKTLGDFLIKSKQPATQQTEKAIIMRDYKIESLITLTWNGDTYVIVR